MPTALHLLLKVLATNVVIVEFQSFPFVLKVSFTFFNKLVFPFIVIKQAENWKNCLEYIDEEERRRLYERNSIFVIVHVCFGLTCVLLS